MLDDKTEIIAHFIGVFELNTEAARLKLQYKEFAERLAENPQLGELFNITINVTSGYGLGGFMPDLKWPLSFVNVPVSNFSVLIPTALGFAPAGVPVLFNEDFFNGFAQPGSVAQQIFTIPLPSSMATVTVQANFMEDMDQITTYEGNAEFIDAAAYNAGVDALAEIGQTLQPLRTPEVATSENAIKQSGLSVSEQINTLSDEGVEPAVEGAEIYVAFDEEISEFTINGESGEELPEIGDVSHRFATEEEEEEAEENTGEAQSASGEILDETSLEEDAHEVLAGNNVLLNEANLVTNWLDAPVISVMGKVVVADAISQVNVFSDVDMINGMAHHSGECGTETYNAAHFEYTSSQPEQEEGEVKEQGEGPQNVVVVTLEGNLINYNYVQQFNFANDGDQLSISFSAHDTMIQTGNNTLVNATSILGLGFHYDLIMVDGDLIDVSYLSQTNVLFDSDMVHYSGEFGGDLTTSDNLLFNWGKINNYGIDKHESMNEAYGKASNAFANGDHDLSSVKGDDAFANTDLLRVLHIKGSILDVQIVDQINVLGDGDQIEFAASTLQSADGANVSITTGQNELMNFGSITDAGIDSTIYTNEGAYTDAFLYQADFVTDEDPLALAASDTLTGEAFLFLADGLLDQEQAEETGMGVEAPAETSVDVMQSVLA